MNLAEQGYRSTSLTVQPDVLAAAVDRTRAASLELERLVSDGWIVESHGPRLLALQLATVQSTSLRQAIATLAEVVVGSSLALRGSDFSAEVSVAGPNVSATCQRDPDGSESEGILAAIDAGDIEQLWSLPGLWSGELNVNLGVFLERALPSVTWRVVRDPSVMTRAIESSHWYEAHQWFALSVPPLAVIATTTDRADIFSTSRLVAASLACSADEIVAALSDILRRAAEAPRIDLLRRQITGRSEERLVAPDFLRSTHAVEPVPDKVGIWAELRGVLTRFAGAHALAWLSSGVAAPGWPTPAFDVRPADASAGGSDTSRLLFIGLQRLAFRVPSGGIDEAAAVEAVGLHDWAVADSSPDRVLAVRQVLSLVDPDHGLDDLGAIRGAAEPLYLSLRRDTIDAVFQNQRQARQLAIDTAQRAVDVAQSTTKSAAERVLAALAGIGGLALAQASSSVPAELARRLGEIVAGYLGAVALWTLCIEGSLLMAPLSVLAEDLRSVGDLLTDSQRDDIAGLASVKSARTRARLVRYLTPAIYALAATFVLALSVPSLGRHLHVASLFT